MSNVTPNLGLQKPLENEYYDINVQNSNMDKIDAAVGNIKVPDASLTQKGIVQLSSTTTSTSETMAATPKAVKAAYDEATAAKQAGNDRKAEVVAALVAKGVAASTSDTWSQLISKMTAIIVASGDATAADLLVGRSASNRNVAFNGAMPNRSNEAVHMPAIGGTVWAGDRIFLQPPNGYYNGSTWVTMPATDVRPEFILQGKKVLDMVGTLPPGKKYATGTVTSGSTKWQFILNNDGSISQNYPATVSGLDFKPSTLVMYSGTMLQAVYHENQIRDGYRFIETGTRGFWRIDGTQAYVSYGGFRLPVDFQSSNYTWHAYE